MTDETEESLRRKLAAATTIIDGMDAQYGITSHMIGNGCEHGFKPARSCPNMACPERELHELMHTFSGGGDD